MTAKQTGISLNLSLSLIDSKEATKADKGRGDPPHHMFHACSVSATFH